MRTETELEAHLWGCPTPNMADHTHHGGHDDKEWYPQVCTCGGALACVGCRPGGSNYYWELRCNRCDGHYAFGTYDYQLRPWNPVVV